MPIPILSVVSKKNCGKTTLLEKLIPELKRRGYRVGTLKHDIHGFDIDHEGKDTFRHKAAGADTVAISCPWKVSIIKDVSEELTPEQLVEQYFEEVDIVLTEGYKQAGFYSVNLNGGSLSTGLYFIRLDASGEITTQRIMLIK